MVDWTLLSHYHTGDSIHNRVTHRSEKDYKAKYEYNTTFWVIWVALKLEYSTYIILSIQYIRDQRLYLKIQHHPSIIKLEVQLKFMLSYQFILQLKKLKQDIN